MDCHICLSLGRENRAHLDTYLCLSCTYKLRNMIREIAFMHELISDPEFLATTWDKTFQPWMGSKAPCDPNILSLTDRRSRYLRKGDPVSAKRVLRWWAEEVERSKSYGHAFPTLYQGPYDVTSLSKYLDNNLAWIVRTPFTERFARHIAATYRSLEKVVPMGDSDDAVLACDVPTTSRVEGSH